MAHGKSRKHHILPACAPAAVHPLDPPGSRPRHTQPPARAPRSPAGLDHHRRHRLHRSLRSLRPRWCQHTAIGNATGQWATTQFGSRPSSISVGSPPAPREIPRRLQPPLADFFMSHTRVDHTQRSCMLPCIRISSQMLLILRCPTYLTSAAAHDLIFRAATISSRSDGARSAEFVRNWRGRQREGGMQSSGFDKIGRGRAVKILPLPEFAL